MDCATAKSRLGGLIEGNLSSEEKAETESHLTSCEGCRLEHHLLQALHGTGSSGPSATPQGAPFGAATVTPPVTAETSPAVPPPPAPVLEPRSAFSPPAPPASVTPPSLMPSPSPPPLVLEPITPTLAAPSDPEVSFADVALSSPTLSGPAPKSEPKAPAGAGSPSAATGGPAKKSWNFEPVDPPRASSPPEDSLQFAEEALSRSSQRAGSRALFRVALWGGGALAGIGLLAVSVWMAMAHREPANDPQALAPPPNPVASTRVPSAPKAAADSATTVGVTSNPAAPSTSVQAPATTSSAAARGSVTAASGTTAPQAAATPPSSALAPASRAGGSPVAPAKGAAPKTAPLTAGTASTSKAAPTATKPVASTASGTATTSRTSASEPPAPETASSPAPPRGGPPTREEGFEPVTDTPADARTEWSRSDLTPAPKRAAASKPPVLVEAPPDEPASKQAADAPDPNSPAGRLHLATVKAQDAHDLDALRKIKASWKSYLRTSLGVDRERSKREYADCLWAIQEMTGKDADRKEALTAYREFVLHAPAGGADARSVSRMRHLEDVLSDSQ